MSCEMLLDEKAAQFFDYYTNTAGIEADTVLESIGSGSTGMSCVESNDNKQVQLRIRNPRSYTLDLNYVFDDPDVQAALTTYPNAVTVVQSSSDKRLATLMFQQEFLHALDNGGIPKYNEAGTVIGFAKNISGRVTVKESESQREFESYHVSITVNSAPPRIRSAIFKRDKAQGNAPNDSHFVVCFNIPNLNGTIHQNDTKTLTIAGEVYQVTFSGSGTPTITRPEGGPVNLSTTAPSPLFNLDSHTPITGFEDLSSEGYLPLYFTTSIDPDLEANANVTVTVSLTDDYGFSKTVSILNSTPQLTPVTMAINADDNDAGSYSVSDYTGTYNLQINHDGTTKRWVWDDKGNADPDDDGYVQVDSDSTPSAPQIVYEIYKTGTGSSDTLVASGTKTAPAVIPVERGKYYVKAYACYAGFIDSAKYNGFASKQTSTDVVTIHRSPNYYVNAAGNAITGNGSINAPFKSIQKCVDQIKTDAASDTIPSAGFNIYLQSDITAIDSDEFDGSHRKALMYFDKGSVSSPFNFTVYGNGHKIDAARSASLVEAGTQDEGRVICIRDALVALENVTISGGYLKTADESGAGIYAIGGTLRLNNTSVKNNTAPFSSAISFPTAYVADVILANVTITGNRTTSINSGAIHVSASNHFGLRGNCQIKDNYKDTTGTAKANFYLEENAYIYCNHSSEYPPVSGSVGVSVANEATGAVRPSPGNPVQVSKWFSEGCNVEPYNFFTSDDPNKGGVIYNDDHTEAVLSGSYATFALDNGKTLSVTLSGSGSITRSGTLSLVVKDENNTVITSSCTFSNHMLVYNMTDPLIGNSYYTPNGNTVTLNSTGVTQTGNYMLYVRITYDGFPYDAQIPFVVN